MLCFQCVLQCIAAQFRAKKHEYKGDGRSKRGLDIKIQTVAAGISKESVINSSITVQHWCSALGETDIFMRFHE